MIYIYLISSFALIITLVYVFRKQIVDYLMRLRAGLKIRSLRQAIAAADKDKEQTGRKNMVVYNTDSKDFEPVSKRLLKKSAKAKVQEQVPDGFRKMKAKKRSSLTTKTVKQIEKKSLYVTN